MGPGDEFALNAVSSFLAAVFVVFAFGLFAQVAREVRDAYSEAAQATEATQSYGSGAGESALQAPRRAGGEGQDGLQQKTGAL